MDRQVCLMGCLTVDSADICLEVLESLIGTTIHFATPLVILTLFL